MGGLMGGFEYGQTALNVDNTSKRRSSTATPFKLLAGHEYTGTPTNHDSTRDQDAQTTDDATFAFSKSLYSHSLPPAFHVERLDIIPDKKLWSILQSIRDVHEQVFPIDSGGSAIAKAWMERIVTSPVVFYAHVFGQIVREECSSTAAAAQLRLVARHLYYRAIEAINRNMANPKTACSDDNILAVLSLANHRLLDDVNPLQGPPSTVAQGPFKSMRLLNLYGGPIDFDEAHDAGVAKMTEVRGGLHALRLPGIAEMMSYAEILTASRVLRPPRLGFIPQVKMDFDASLSTQWRVDHPLRHMGTGFDSLTSGAYSLRRTKIQLALNRLALYSLCVDDYVAGRPSKLSLSILGEQRNFVQHSMISLMSLHFDKTDLVSRVCHLAGLVYSFLCVWPAPYAPFQDLVHRIRYCLPTKEFSAMWTTAPHLVLWILFISGVVSTGADRLWTITILERCFRKLQVDSWEALKAILQTFLWLPITNDADGESFWEEIEASSPFDPLHRRAEDLR